MIKIGTTFSGIGAPEQAFKNLNIPHSIEWACDIDPKCKETYEQNHTCKQWYGDINDVDSAALAPIDFYWFSFPCTDLSPEGRLDLTNGESSLVHKALEILDTLLPPYMVFENVEGLTWPRFKDFYEVIKARIEKNYDFHLYHLNAEDFGLAQSRPRVFGVGVRKDLGKKVNNFKFNHSSAYLQHILETVAPAKYWLSQERNDLIIKNTLEKQPGFVLENRLGEVKHTRSNSYRPQKKIRYSEVSFCLTASCQHGIITPENKIRHFTPRECARLMGFPDSFKLHQYDSYAYNQLGNSVAVPVIEQLLSNLL